VARPPVATKASVHGAGQAPPLPTSHERPAPSAVAILGPVCIRMMTVLPAIIRYLTMSRSPDRRRIRLPPEAYRRPGTFLVTVVTASRMPLLGHLSGGECTLSVAGLVVRDALLDAPTHWSGVKLDEWVLMPDHIHAIIHLTERLDAGLPSVVAGFKAASTRQLRSICPDHDAPLWQRSFHDRQIRTAAALAAARSYVRSNPSRP
jgi:putative transposase